jgi:hypothetical protein
MQLLKSVRKKKWLAILTPLVGILAYLAELILPSLLSPNEPPKVENPLPPVNYFVEDNSFTDNSVHDYSFTDNSLNDHSFTDNSVKNHSFTDNSVNNHSFTDNSVRSYSSTDNSVKDDSVNDSFNNYLLNEQSVNDSFPGNSFNFPFRRTNRNKTQLDSFNRNENQFLLADAAKVEIPPRSAIAQSSRCLCCDSVKVKDDEKKQVYEVTVAPGGSKYWAEYPEAAYW